MKISEVYDRYLLKVEKNSTNDNISTDKQRFLELFNIYSIVFTEYIYGLKNEESMRYIQNLLVKELNINKGNKHKDHYSFLLPENYLLYSSAFALGSKGECENRRIDLPIEVLDIEKDLYYNDSNTSPSFEYRESFITIASNNINVFYTDFSVNSLILSYYRYPKKYTLTDPNNPESDFEDEEVKDFDEKSINKILSATASGFDINNNSERWQLHNIFAKKSL